MNVVRRMVATTATVTLLALSLTPPAYAADAEPTTRGTAIVGFSAGTLPAVAVGDDLRGHVVERVEPRAPWLLVQASDLAQLRADLAGTPGLAYIEDNATALATVTPNDTRYGEQFGPPMMGFPTAWSRGFGSSAIKVSVIDSGLLRNHEDFTPASRFLTGFDYVNGDTNPDDTCGHGTHVSGTVGATTNNARGVAGMSQATILPMKALTADLLGCSGSYADINQAIMDSADQGAKVISMSIGGPAATSLENAVNYAWNKGVLLVAASGNDGGSNSVDYPAAYANVIAVGALTSGKVRASYSDGGPQLDIMAPGSNVLSTSSGGGYELNSGTSMATPHVSGALAFALSCAPAGTTATTVRNALYSTAEDLGAAGFDNLYGNGLARADRLADQICGGGGGVNTPPIAALSVTPSGLTVSVNGSGSTDPDGDPLTYSWTFGDGGTATGVTATHTYAAPGTFTITVTVNDGRGGTNSKSQSISVVNDPDPGAPTLASGQAVTFTVADGAEAFYKISVPAGAGQLQVVMDGPNCFLGVLCFTDHDLYTRFNARPNDTTYACRPFEVDSDETCTHASPTAGYWYIRVHSAGGSGSITLRATVT